VALLAVARVAGASVLAFTSSGQNFDRGDLFFAQVWTGLFSLASALLALSLVGPVSPPVSLSLLTAVALLLLFGQSPPDIQPVPGGSPDSFWRRELSEPRGF